MGTDNSSASADCACQSSNCQCTAGGRCSGSLPDNPSCALNYHFGMLLGVDDLRAEQGFHLGQQRRHQRALHGFGVVYGYNISFNPAKAELQVSPGLALDPFGRDLSLEQMQCLSLPAWWLKHYTDDDFADARSPADGGRAPSDITFDADVVLHYRTCLSRPVPAIADACATTQADIAYSRICESVQLSLQHRRRDEPAAVVAQPTDYHLLLLFLGLEAPRQDADGVVLAADQWLLDAQASLLSLPVPEQAAARQQLWRAALNRAVAHSPGPISAASSLTDELTQDGIILARLSDVHIFEDRADPAQVVWRATLGAIDLDQRPSLLPTQLLQRLLMPTAASAAGPRLIAASRSGTSLSARFDKPLAAASLTPAVLAVHSFDSASGWSSQSFSALSYDAASLTISLSLDAAPGGQLLRLSVLGTGATPLLGADLIPAGAADSGSPGIDQHMRITGE